MRKACLILLLLSACGSSNKDAGEDDAAAAANLLSAEGLPQPGQDPAQLQALIDRAMPAALPDAKNARYRNVRAGVGGAACGEVSPRGGDGGPFVPFVVTPDAIPVVGTAPRIAFDDPADFLADAWIRWCASPEELERLGPDLARAAAKTAAARAAEANASAAIPADLPPLDPPPAAAPAPAPEPPPPPPKAKAPPPPPRIDSFFNSVDRQP